MSDQNLTAQTDGEQQPLPVAVCVCGKRYRIKEGWSGRTVSCRTCGHKLLLTVSPSSEQCGHVISETQVRVVSVPTTDPPPKEGGASWTKFAVSCMACVVSWCKRHVAEVLGSVAIHGGAALVLLAILLEQRNTPDLKPLSAVIDLTAPELQDVDQIVLTELSESLSPSAEIAPPIQQLSASVLQPAESFEPQMPELKFEAPANAGTADMGENGSKRKGRSGSEGDGEGNGNGGTTFFGKKLSVSSIAYVIDASGSMSGARFQRARKELVNALLEMKKTQKFFIVFYTDQTYPMFWPNSVVELLPANKNNLRNTGAWLEGAKTSGGTEPQQAMRLALSLKPDVVFLLSDGDIPEETRTVVTQQNKGSVIHTIALGSDTGAAVMQQIAAENKGEFRFIPDGP